MEIMHFKGLRFGGIGLCVGILLGPVGESAWAWSVLENSALSTTRIAPGIISQSFQASHYFSRPEEYVAPKVFSQTYFEPIFKPNGTVKGLSKQNSDPQKENNEEKYEEKNQADYLPFVWSLGVGYQRAESPATAVDLAVVDETVTGLLGMSWQLSPQWKPGFEFIMDSSAAEAYGHVAALFSLEWVIPLRKLKKNRTLSHVKVDEDPGNYDPNDALQFYAHERKAKASRALAAAADSGQDPQDQDDGEPNESGLDRWKRKNTVPAPYVKFVYHVGFGSHGISNKTYRRVSLGKAAIAGQTFNQYQAGVDVVFVPKSAAAYTFGFYAYLYDTNINTFIPLIEADAFRRQPIVARSGLTALGNQALAFPIASFDQRGEWRLNDRESLIFEINESIYGSTLQPPTYGLSQTYFTSLGKDWRGGVSGTVLLGGVASPLLSLGILIDYQL